MTGYRNNWWQVYTGKATEIRMFAGYSGYYFDSSGRGLRAAGWEGWALCNGQNGALDLQDYFVIPGFFSQGIYNSWIAGISPAAPLLGIWTVQAPGALPNTGIADFHRIDATEREFTVTLLNFPIMFVWLNGTNFYKFQNSIYDGGALWMAMAPVANNGSWNSSLWTYQMDQWSAMVSTPISRIPPYIAVGFVQFVGYQ
jgi:hypothetical protein